MMSAYNTTVFRRALHHSLIRRRKNSIYRHRFLPALAEIAHSVVPYVSNLYAREPPKLLFALDGGGLQVVESAQGIQE